MVAGFIHIEVLNGACHSGRVIRYQFGLVAFNGDGIGRVVGREHRALLVGVVSIVQGESNSGGVLAGYAHAGARGEGSVHGNDPVHVVGRG